MTTKVTDEARIDLKLTKKDAIQFWLTLINEYHFTSVFHWSGKEKVNKCPEMRYSQNDFNGLFKSYLHYFREAYVLGFKFWTPATVHNHPTQVFILILLHVILCYGSEVCQ